MMEKMFPVIFTSTLLLLVEFCLAYFHCNFNSDRQVSYLSVDKMFYCFFFNLLLIYFFNVYSYDSPPSLLQESRKSSLIYRIIE